LKCNKEHDAKELEKDGNTIIQNIHRELKRAPLEVKQLIVQLYYEKFHDLDPFIFRVLIENGMAVLSLKDNNLLKREEIFIIGAHGPYSVEALFFYITMQKYMEITNNPTQVKYCVSRVMHILSFYNCGLGKKQKPGYECPMKLDTHDKYFDSTLYNSLPE